MVNKKIEIEDMLETRTIKDMSAEDGYSLGIYSDRIALNGFYLKAKRGSLLERIEQMAKVKFQLENDPENYAQVARLEFWLSLNKYYDKFGYDENIKADGFIYTDVKYKLMDMAKLAKGNVSVCDRATGKYYINKIESYEKKFIEENDKIKNQKDERALSELYRVFNDETETTSEFRKWLEENKEYILTKKQIDYLSGDTIIGDASGSWRIRKNIVKRVEESYVNDKIKIEKKKSLEKQKKSISYILDFKDEFDFINRLKKISIKKGDNLIENIYEKLSMKNCSIFTNILNEEINTVEDKRFFYEVISIITYEELSINESILNLDRKEDMYKW